jgi:hypothetical protein
LDCAKRAGDLLAKSVLNADELLDASCWLRTAFEVGVREFLINSHGKVLYRDDWTKLTFNDIWAAAIGVMERVNPTAASSFIADIQFYKNIFLDDWEYSTVSRLTKPDLDAARNALMDPASPRKNPKTRLATFR